jgi:uncharacterized membrane protein (UPF0127 family)
MSRNRPVATALLLLTMMSAVTAQPAVAALEPAACAQDVALFMTPDGARAVRVEIADDPQERARGLMFRESLPADTGMLFLYETPRESSFWMKNTYLRLDIVFMDARGVIRYIHRNARPLDETPIPGALAGDPDPLRLAILEVAAGEADRLGLATGQPMAYPALDQGQAAWPCR